jgi:branched-chain amino acid transport system substrate-binding protein
MKQAVAFSLLTLAALAAQAADLKIGVAEALSGGAAQYGVAIRNGFELAAAEINAAGGINGNKIELVIADEQGKKEEAINGLQEADLPGQGADGVRADAVELGPGRRPDRQGRQDRGVRHLQHRRRHHLDRRPRVPQLGDRGRRAARVTMRDRGQARRHQEGRGASTATTTPSRRAATTSSRSRARPSLKIAVTGDRDLCQGRRRLQGAADQDQSRQSGRHRLLLPWPRKPRNIILQTRALGMKQPFIGGNGLNSVEAVRDRQGRRRRHRDVGSPWSAENPAPANQKFIAAYRARIQGRARPVRRPGLRRDVHRQRGAEVDQADRQPGERPRRAVRAALPAVRIDRRHRRRSSSARRPRPAASRSATTRSRIVSVIVNIARGGKFVPLK